MSAATQKVLYPLVDALQCTMAVTKAGARGIEAKRAKVGPVALPFKIQGYEDYLTAFRACVLFHIRGNLWVYGISDDHGRADCRLTLAFFDGGGLTEKEILTGDPVSTLARVASQIKGCYEWTGQAWKTIPPEKMCN